MEKVRQKRKQVRPAPLDVLSSKNPCDEDSRGRLSLQSYFLKYLLRSPSKALTCFASSLPILACGEKADYHSCGLVKNRIL